MAPPSGRAADGDQQSDHNAAHVARLQCYRSSSKIPAMADPLQAPGLGWVRAEAAEPAQSSSLRPMSHRSRRRAVGGSEGLELRVVYITYLRNS